MLVQNLSQKQHLKILPQQIQLLNLFHLNTLELEHRLQQELEENPLLEESYDSEDESEADKYNKEAAQDYQDFDEFAENDIPDYKMEYEGYLHSDKIPERPIKDIIDFRKELKEQFMMQYSCEKEILLADYLIDSLNDNGLLEQDLRDIAEDLSFKTNTWMEAEDLEKVLVKIQQLEPVGIGARSIQECLLIQLHRLNTKRPDVKIALRLLEDHYIDLRNRNMGKIMSHLNVDEEEIKIVLQLLGTLKMKPIAEREESLPVNQNILPDFIIVLDGDELEINLYRHRSESLYISQSWKEMVQYSPDKATRQYLKTKLNAAQWFVNAIQQRERTMLKVMKAIVKTQYEFFKTGDIKLLKPMILKNIADQVGVDISTVSRITCNKYAETPFGMLLLKDLFTEGIINQQGEVISNKVIQTAIEEVIETEDKKKPFTDQELAAILSTKGYTIARRTVAKYREQLQIPVAQMRALWA